jgi:superfamily II DNA/RNA helicase
VPLSARGLRDYAELKKQFFADLETHAGKKTIPIINMLARTTRLRQYLVDPSVLGAAEDSVKFPAIVDILEEAQRPTVIFTSFTQAGLHLVDYLTKRHFKTAMLHGAVKEKDRERLKAEFLRGTMDALIIQTQLGSESLNLGKYGCVAFLDLPWNARDLEQAEGRVDRPEEGTGISVPTTSYFILVEDSYEMRLQKKVEAKHAMFQDVFSVADLEELFA